MAPPPERPKEAKPWIQAFLAPGTGFAGLDFTQGLVATFSDR